MSKTTTDLAIPKKPLGSYYFKLRMEFLEKHKGEKGVTDLFKKEWEKIKVKKGGSGKGGSIKNGNERERKNFKRN